MQLDHHALEPWLEQIKATAAGLARHQEQAAQAEQQQQRAAEQLQQQLAGQRSRLAQLEGSLRVIAERLEAIADPSPAALQEAEAQLQHIDADLQALQRGHQGNAEGLEAQLQALEQEKNQLLSQRGQAEQLCQSLGAVNPQAELEQRQAAREEAQAERQRLERQGQALQLLRERFHRAQAELANRYSEPLREAIRPYLAELASDSGEPLLSFDPQQGFQDLQLRQRGEAYGFAQLSGGMREQLAAALRLAMAEVLLPAYDGALPLVFDDAFTQSDPQRLMGLQHMLRHAMGQGIQLVVLSCQPETFQDKLVETPTPTNNKPPAKGRGLEHNIKAGETQDDVVVVSLGDAPSR